MSSAPPPFGLTAPPPELRRRRGGTVALVAAVLAVVLAATFVVVAYLHRTPEPQLSEGPVVVPPVSVAQGRLDDRVRTDRPAADALAERWVPQLHAVRIGTGPGDVASADDVLRRRDTVVADRPGALLVASADYTSFEKPGWYVLVAPRGFATSAEALAWCRAEGLSRTSCYAKRLSHTAGPAGSTVYAS
ncbi:hypothetical protein [Pseudonocardia sp.]|uniref:hypothetical protein n=1 Tax=Pseudonocardia sp. TaxID=60912 RepID=UPI003D101B99